MYTLPNQFPLDGANTQGHPVAILSGESIYLVFPNGDVKFIPSQLVANLKTILPLDQYRFWGYLEIA